MKLSLESTFTIPTGCIKSITALFEGQNLKKSIVDFKLREEGMMNLINGICTSFILSEEQILKNLQVVQAKMKS